MGARNVRVTAAGGIAAALLVAAWVAGLAAGRLDPGGWIAAILGLPFGMSLFIGAVSAVFVVVGAVCHALGRPWFVPSDDN